MDLSEVWVSKLVRKWAVKWPHQVYYSNEFVLQNFEVVFVTRRQNDTIFKSFGFRSTT